MASRSFGGVSMTDSSRIPASERWSERGIGVADIDEDVDRRPHLLDPLLLRHAEALLLVDDEEAEVAERNVLRQKPVGSDDDVERPFRQAAEYPADLRRTIGSAREDRS